MKRFLDAIHVPNWVVAILAVVLILRIPSFFEPYSYGDEMIYLTLGQGIRQGVTLYQGIYDNKPPLLYVTAAIAGNLFWFKVILAFWNLATIIIFWKLTRALFKENVKLQKVATFLFALLTTLPLLEGNIANAELFMIGPTMLAFLILLTQKLSPRNLVISGMLFSVAALFKIPAAFDIPAIVVFWLIKSGLKKDKVMEVVKNTLYLAGGFLAPILISFVFFFFQGALKDYFAAAFLQNVGYLSSFRPGDVAKPFLVRNAPLITRSLIVLAGSVILFIRRAKLSDKFIFVSLWLLFSLFAVTLSERPYPHYFIQAVPAVSILLAVLIAEDSFEQSLAIIPLTLAFVVPVYFRFYVYPTGAYYLRFIKFAGHQISQSDYFNSFGGDVNRNYAISEFVVKSLRPGDKIFVWGDSPAIYALTKKLPPEKYTAAYHINDYGNKKEIAGKIDETKTKFIVLLGSPFSELMPILRKEYILINSIEGAEIYSRSEKP